MTRLAILVSGDGSNLQALIDGTRTGRIAGEICCVISNHPNIRALERAHAAGIEGRVIDDPDAHIREHKIRKALDSLDIDLICLAGYMRILSETLVVPYLGRIINIHPSLLPRYRGAHTHRRILEAGEKEHGCSVHFVTPELDEGPIIIQACVPVYPDDTVSVLAQRVLEQEHQIFPLAIKWYCDGQLRMKDGAAWLHDQHLSKPILHETTSY